MPLDEGRCLNHDAAMRTALDISEDLHRQLTALASSRGESFSQMAVGWRGRVPNRSGLAQRRPGAGVRQPLATTPTPGPGVVSGAGRRHDPVGVSRSALLVCC
jgi:hypothetical protein